MRHATVVSRLVARLHRLRAGVHQHEAAGAVGVLDHARAERSAGRTAPPADRPRCPRSGCARPAGHRRSPRSRRSTRRTSRQHRARDVRRAASSSSSQSPRVDVEQQRARRVARVRDVRCAAGQFPDQPACRSCRTRVRPLRARARAPGTLSSIQRSFVPEKYASSTRPVFARESRLQAARFQLIAKTCRAPVLPHDRVAYGLAGRAVPHDRRLALIGNADGGDVARGDSGPCDGLGCHADLGCPDFVRVVLDPARLREYLAKLLLRNRLDRAAAGRTRWRANWSCPDRARG